MLTAARRQAIAAAAARTGTPSAIAGVAPARPAEGAAALEYRMQLMQLGQDLRRLKDTQSTERKIAAKRIMLPAYLPWLDAALAAETPAQDEIVTTMLIWSIDIGDWPLAKRLAAHVLQHRLELPERFERTPGTLIAEEVAEAALAPGNEAAPALSILQDVDDLTEKCDMPDQVRAKLKKAIGLAFKQRADTFDPQANVAIAGGKPALIATALAYLTRALVLDPKCGVKKLIDTLQRDAKKPAADQTTAATTKPAIPKKRVITAKAGIQRATRKAQA